MFRKVLAIYQICLIFLTIIKYYIFLKFLKFGLILEKSSNNKKKAIFVFGNQNRLAKILKKAFKILNIRSCLIKSLTSHEIMKKNGHESTLLIGVSLNNSEFKSHAWIKLKDEILMESYENFSNYKIIYQHKSYE